MDTARIAAGIAGRLQLTFERRGDRTVLARSYAEPPFRVGPVIPVDDAAYVFIVCTGPGVFGGDDLRQSIHVGPGARVMLTSQSALQVHPSGDRSPATLRHEYRVDRGGELQADWDPTIPFAGARCDQRILIDIAAGGRLFWSDALMSGRAGRGEAWRFASLAHELRVRIGGSLGYLERYRLTADRMPMRTWLAGRAHYVGTVLAVDPAAGAPSAAELQAALASAAGTTAGVDVPKDGLLVARLLSTSGPSFAGARDLARTFVVQSLFGRAAAVKRK